MAKDLEKTTKQHTTPTAPTPDTASRLKRELMSDAVGRMLGRDDAEPIAPGPAHVLLALANHGRSPSWKQWKVRQREMYTAANGMKIKLAFFGEDDEEGVRRLKISKHWKNDADSMAGHMDRAQAQCTCGCFVNIRAAFQQAVKENAELKENAEQRMRAVIIDGDMFHDSQEDLDEAALAANQLRREGTRVFLVQQGDNPDTARKLQYLERVAGAAYFRFGEQHQQKYADLLNAVSAYATGGEAAVKSRGGQAATLLLEHLRQPPMPILSEEAERIARDPSK